MNALGARRDRGQHGFGRGDREVAAVMLAKANEVEAELVGQNRLVDDVADHLRMRKHGTGGVLGDVAKGIQSEF